MPAVFSVTSVQLMSWMVAFLWPFVRILALVSTAPVFGESSVPRQVKVMIAALLTLVLAPGIDTMPALPVVSIGGVWVLIQQILIGVAMGFTMRMVFSAVQVAGEYIGLQMGLSFASFYDPMNGGSTVVVGRILYMLALLLFLAIDGHLLLISALAESFQSLPISDAPLRARGWMLLAEWGGQIFTTGLMLALPLVTALLTLNLAMGILNRASPQFSIFTVGLPITLLAGIGMLQLLVPQLLSFLAPRMAAGLSSLDLFTRALKP